MVGRWGVDCGHDSWQGEIHPYELVVSSFIQTAPLLNFTDITGNNTGSSNLPAISQQWHQLTGGRPATVTKVGTTGAWEGETLSFDIWPPPRPSASALLHWARDVPPDFITGSTYRVSVTNVLSPPGPPGAANHLRVTVASQERPAGLEVGGRGDVTYTLPQRYLAAYLLWWEEPPVVGPGPSPD
jgi:hypothetical protein